MDELAEECMQKFPHVKITASTICKIYYGAKLDLAKTLVAALNDINDREVCNYLLNVKFEEKDGQSLTPLVLAITAGHLTFVRTILSHYEIDLETECNIIFDGVVVYGATALWIAAGTGHLNIVKFLVQQGADINHNTKAQSSPLRAACYDGRCEIVKYLIEHGANVNLANNFNNTCLMIASYKGHCAVTQALLQHGADPNRQALCGATALHYAAECGHLDICELLLSHGAKLMTNEHGLTPAVQAAERTRASVVIMFSTWPNIMSKEEKITAIELLGASFGNDEDNYDVGKAFKYLMNAMTLRYEDPDNIIRKRTIPPIPAYDNWIETETVQDLQAIRLNHHFIHMESLTIRERILGKNYPDLPRPIVYRGAIFADLNRFDMCCTLWTYAIDLRMGNGDPVDRDLLRFAQLFSQMLRLEQTLEVSAVLSVLERCQKEIERNKRKIASPGPKDIPPQIADELDNNIVTALYLIKIITVLIGAKDAVVNKQEISQLYSIITTFIKCNTRLRDGQTLLHRAVNGVTPVDDFYTNEICRFPCLHTSRLLVHAGALVNDEDCERNTPLHVLISSLHRDNSASISNAEKIIQLFANAGAHLDAVNAQGLTPAQLAAAPAISNILLKYQHKYTTLKCLSARTVAIHKLQYKGHVPRVLELFVRMHSAEKVDL